MTNQFDRDKAAEEYRLGMRPAKMGMHEAFLAGAEWQAQQHQRGQFEVLGLSVEQIEKLKTFFEAQTGMKAEEYGGSITELLVKENGQLKAEVARLKLQNKSLNSPFQQTEKALHAYRAQCEVLAVSLEFYASMWGPYLAKNKYLGEKLQRELNSKGDKAREALTAYAKFKQEIGE